MKTECHSMLNFVYFGCSPICYRFLCPPLKLESQLSFSVHTPRQPTRLTTTNAVEISRREWGVNTCLGITCHGSNWSVASCSQAGTYSLLPLIDFSSVCSLSRWLFMGNRCGPVEQYWKPCAATYSNITCSVSRVMTLYLHCVNTDILN